MILENEKNVGTKRTLCLKNGKKMKIRDIALNKGNRILDRVPSKPDNCSLRIWMEEELENGEKYIYL